VYNHLMDSGIYGIRNLVNNKVYVGKSCRMNKRWSKHKKLLKEGSHPNSHLQSAYNKYGLESFEFRTIEVCEESLLDQSEVYWINYFNSTNPNCGYNKVPGGQGGRLNPESLAKMAASMKGKKMSKTSKAKIAAALTGVPRPQTVRDKISKTKTGEVKSKAHKTKISKTLKGRKLSLKTRTKMSETRKGRKQPKLVCPHCRKSGGTTMRRWHFDNCRVKNGI
jgi:group I intron endonuclease